MSKFLTKLNQEPAAIVGLVSALVATVVGFNLGLTSTTGALVVAAVEALLGVYLARAAQETLFAAVTQAAKVLLALAVGFGAHISDQQALLLVGLVTAGLAAFARTQINPEAGSPTVPTEEEDDEWEDYDGEDFDEEDQPDEQHPAAFALDDTEQSATTRTVYSGTLEDGEEQNLR